MTLRYPLFTSIKTSTYRRFAVVLLSVVTVLVLFPLSAAAQKEGPFSVSGSVSSRECMRGDTLTFNVEIKIADGYYLQTKMTSVRALKTEGIEPGEVTYTGNKNGKFLNKAEASFPAYVKEDAPDSINATVLVSYQGCKNDVCLFPETDTLNYTIKVTDGGSETGPAGETGPGSVQKDGIAGMISGGGFVALLAAFLGGLLTCLTPCVYPLIPVTLAVFGASSQKTKLNAFFMSLVYVAGISVMFSVLGFIFGSTGAVFGQFMANPWVVAFIFLVFSLFGISLLGAFDFQLPSGIQSRLTSAAAGKSGMQRTFLMGLVAGIIAAPCTGPSLAAILTYVAAKGSRGFAILMLLSFSWGLGLPFLILGTFSGLIARRPKPGPWMEGVKSLLAVFMFVLALYFVHSIVPSMDSLFSKSTPYLITMFLLVTSGIAAGGIHLSYHGTAPVIKIRKTLGVILISAGIFGTLGSVLWAQQRENSTIKGEGIEWINGIETGLEKAEREGKPAMIDFYADWCLACKELDSHTFSKPEVRQRLKDFVCIKADLTKQNRANTETAKEHSVSGLPVIDFYNSSGEKIKDKRIRGFMTAKEFLQHIEGIE